MARDEKAAGYRPGTLGWYLTQAGWEPVPQDKGHPMWKRDGQITTANEAYLTEMRRIWRETRAKLAQMNGRAA